MRVVHCYSGCIDMEQYGCLPDLVMRAVPSDVLDDMGRVVEHVGVDCRVKAPHSAKKWISGTISLVSDLQLGVSSFTLIILDKPCSQPVQAQEVSVSVLYLTLILSQR